MSNSILESMNKLILVCIAVLFFMVCALPPSSSSSSFAQQQEGEPQVGSDGELTATLNGDSFTTGDTIIVNGTVEEQDPQSYVSIEVYDPQRSTVERELVRLSEDNAFTYSFVAGELAEFDPDFWMQNSGTYRMVVRYTPPDLTLDREVVEFAFEYTATTSITTSGGATTTEEVTGGGDNNNATSSTGAINVTTINQSTAQAIRYTELAYLAVQNNNSRDILANLSLALDELDNMHGNLTTLTTSADNNSSNESGNITARTADTTDDNTTTTIVISIVPGPSRLTDAFFQPNPVQVSIGDTVEWINRDSIPHTVTSRQNLTPDEQFDSGILTPNSPFEHTFTEAGEYPYSCVLHPNHGGTVIVS
ncbi:MAG: plastocyanin/azurin family copper-binding protein [Thermoproteota archaeon]|nr:plastocyanin/azurin family copper-binding protein [Thermoproteota archaeon]